MKDEVIVEKMALNTPFGDSVDCLFSKLCDNDSALKKISRFNANTFLNDVAAEIVCVHDPELSVVWRILQPLKDEISSWNADLLILATTKGEIDLLEKNCGNNASGTPYPTLPLFLKKSLSFFSIQKGIVVSAACASSNIAIAQAAEIILNKQANRVAVLGVDIVSKFIYSGFSALHALSPDKNSSSPAKPFDSNRNGLIPGEACAAMLLTRSCRQKNYCGKVLGWGASGDANHVTGPSRDGRGLASAIGNALHLSGLKPEHISAVSAHGTGTVYNDAMEMKAFLSIFSKKIPLFSVKGALGHTMGASGILESVIALKSLEYDIVPPTYGCADPEESACGWVRHKVFRSPQSYILKTNSGFGGINAALILSS